jgi:hypothetical protein
MLNVQGNSQSEEENKKINHTGEKLGKEKPF